MITRNLKRFKLVTFDCTNTLLYFKRPVNHQYLKVATEMGHKRENFDESKIMPSFRKHFKELRETYPNFGRTSIGFETWWSNLVQNVLSDAAKDDKKPKDFENVADALIKLYETKECWAKYDGTDELIRALKHHGKLIGIISNFDPRLHVLLRDLQMYKKFDFIITSYEARVEKPNREIFGHALDKSLGLTWNMIYPNEALHIGNEFDKDYEGATNAGWTSVLISSDSNHINHKNCFKSLKNFFDVVSNEEINL